MSERANQRAMAEDVRDQEMKEVDGGYTCGCTWNCGCDPVYGFDLKYWKETHPTHSHK